MAKRILHCLRAPVGGLFRHVRDLAAEQAKMGHAVGVLCDELASDSLSEARLDELSQHLSLGLTRLPMNRHPDPRDWNVIRATLQLIETKSINVIHGHGAKGGAYARLAARAFNRRSSKQQSARIRCIYTPHGGSLHFHPATMKGRLYMTLERYLSRYSDAIAFESAYSAEVYARQIGKPPCPTAIIPNGLQPEEFIPVRPATDATDFLFIGELRHLKGVDVLLSALAAMNGKQPASATIVGAGPDEGEFKKQCTGLGLDQLVRFTGALPARDAFTMGRALVIPSRAESFPYIVLEAAAAGLPLFASNVGGIPEIVADTGVKLLPAGDAGALRDALCTFLADPAPYAETAARLKARVKDNFTVAAMATAVDALYSSTG